MAVDFRKIGLVLKARREEKGIGLGEVSDALCLRKSLIEAIESGDLDALPHEVYIRSYLKEYANFLNISEEILPELIEKKEESMLTGGRRSAKLRLHTPAGTCSTEPSGRGAL